MQARYSSTAQLYTSALTGSPTVSRDIVPPVYMETSAERGNKKGNIVEERTESFFAYMCQKLMLFFFKLRKETSVLMLYFQQWL